MLNFIMIVLKIYCNSKPLTFLLTSLKSLLLAFLGVRKANVTLGGCLFSWAWSLQIGANHYLLVFQLFWGKMLGQETSESV